MAQSPPLVRVSFPYNDIVRRYITAVAKEAKFDRANNGYAMPAAAWSEIVGREDLAWHVRDVTNADWNDVIEAVKALQAATVTPIEQMPQYVFVGGGRRFRQVH